jgi:SAM-dependent methyltransferase
VRVIVLRVIRKILRRLDVALDSSGAGAVEELPPNNDREAAIENFLSSIDLSEPGAVAYFQQHKQRLVRTLSILPLGISGSRALELGSYLHMAAALQRVLGYPIVRPAYYARSIGHNTASLPIKGQQPFTTEGDLFDAESHVYPYSDSSFDLVLCCELIEHLLHDPMHMLMECWRVLVDGGRLLITTPNTASLTSVWAVLDGRHNPQVFSRYPARGNTDIPHVREYTPHEIAQAVRSAGFQIDALFTERMEGAHHATWVLDILKTNAFETALRGEQIYCVGRKQTPATFDRFPAFLYSR